MKLPVQRAQWREIVDAILACPGQAVAAVHVSGHPFAEWAVGIVDLCL